MRDLTRPASARVPASIRIRAAESRDASAIAAIYNDGIAGRGATFEVGVYERHAPLDGVWRDVVIVERLVPANQRG